MEPLSYIDAETNNREYLYGKGRYLHIPPKQPSGDAYKEI